MFSDTSLAEEINKIQASNNNVLSRFSLTAVLHTKEKDITAQSVVGISFLCDYVNNITDYIELIVLMDVMDYREKVMPSRGTLEVTIKSSPTTALGDDVVGNIPIMMERLRARLPEDNTTSINGNSTEDLTQQQRVNAGFIEVSLQLTNPIIEQLRVLDVGGIYTAVTPPDLVRTLLTHWSTIDSTDTYSFKGVDMVSSNNKQVRNNLVIDHNVKLTEVPKYIQDKCGGVYSSGIGYYLSGGFWYVYPLYDVKRFDVEKKTVTIIMAAAKNYANLRKTYRKAGDSLTIAITTPPTVIDDTESIQQNSGNGVRFVDATKVFSGFGAHDGNKYTINEQDNVFEFLANDREGKDNIAHVSETVIHSNPYRELSKLTRGNTVHVQVEWTESDSELIYPGMPAKVVHWNSTEVKEDKGTVLAKEVFYERLGNSTSVEYKQTTILTIGISKVI